MIISNTQNIYFSPTHTSKQVAEAIVRGVGTNKVATTDLTVGVIPETILPASTLAVIAVPVYGGHVAPSAMERLRCLRGTNTPAALVVVYGNRAYEKALVELDWLMMEQGFKVIAAATFIGEHSYSNSNYPIAYGRPDEDDLQAAFRFGEQVAQKIAAAETPDTLYSVDVSRIPRPAQPFIQLLRFLGKVIALRKRAVPLPRTPWVKDENLCTHCGLCVKCCPVGAVALGDELHIDAQTCIKCCACVKSCPKKAKVYDTPFAALLSQCFRKQKKPQTIV